MQFAGDISTLEPIDTPKICLPVLPLLCCVCLLFLRSPLVRRIILQGVTKVNTVVVWRQEKGPWCFAKTRRVEVFSIWRPSCRSSLHLFSSPGTLCFIFTPSYCFLLTVSHVHALQLSYCSGTFLGSFKPWLDFRHTVVSEILPLLVFAQALLIATFLIVFGIRFDPHVKCKAHFTRPVGAASDLVW